MNYTILSNFVTIADKLFIPIHIGYYAISGMLLDAFVDFEDLKILEKRKLVQKNVDGSFIKL